MLVRVEKHARHIHGKCWRLQNLRQIVDEPVAANTRNTGNFFFLGQFKIDAIFSHQCGLSSAQIQLDEAIHGLNRYLQKIDLDPARLEQVEERMQALHGAARKYRIEADELPRLLLETSERLDAFTASQNIDTLREKVKQEELAYLKLAKQLSQKRNKASEDLGKQVTEAMQHLSMSGGRLEIALTPLQEGGSHGLEQIEFLVAGHAGSTPRSLAKVASGGELARISLAISVITSKASFTPTLIFDEVDAGIGGAVAETVGKLLHQLGQSHQIDRKSTRLNSSHTDISRMPSSA